MIFLTINRPFNTSLARNLYTKFLSRVQLATFYIKFLWHVHLATFISYNIQENNSLLVLQWYQNDDDNYKIFCIEVSLLTIKIYNWSVWKIRQSERRFSNLKKTLIGPYLIMQRNLKKALHIYEPYSKLCSIHNRLLNETHRKINYTTTIIG